MATTCEHFDLESEAPASRVVGAYRDGHPFDRVQYLESKIILKADRFNSVASFHHFGKLVRRTAKKLHVGFAADTNAWARPQVREIVFADTPDFRLYNHSFILRRRIRYQDGFPVGDPEIVLKFRHPDEETAAAVGIRPEIAGTYRMKFKMEALPLKTDIGGFRFLYSHNCVFGLSQMHDADKLSMQTLTHIFPALSELKKSEEERVTIVSEAISRRYFLTSAYSILVRALLRAAMWLSGAREESTGRWSANSPSRRSLIIRSQCSRRPGSFVNSSS